MSSDWPLGNKFTLTTDFQALARDENVDLGHVYAVSFRADPKNQVSESDEHNNWDSRPTGYDVSNLELFTYNEALVTILRGIQLNDVAAGELELTPGYYRISEHRVDGNSEQRVIALHIFKNYFQSAMGTSSPPKRDDAFVFSIIDQYDYGTTGFRFSGRDFHGHTLSFDIDFQQGCFSVNSVRLNCTTPMLTVQTALTEVLNTCGVTTEPPWSTPHPH